MCVAQCGLYQEPKIVAESLDQRCFCKQGLVFDENAKECVPEANKTWEGLQNACTAENRLTSLLYTSCSQSCAENETPINNHCECSADYALSANRTFCVSKSSSDCLRTLDMNDRVPRGETCIFNTTCNPEKYKLSLDGKKCVTSCKLWVENDEDDDDEAPRELRCVEECPDWWFSEEDGLCVNNEWKLDLAISVPVIIVIVATIVCATLYVTKHRARPGKWQDITEEMKSQLAQNGEQEVTESDKSEAKSQME